MLKCFHYCIHMYIMTPLYTMTHINHVPHLTVKIQFYPLLCNYLLSCTNCVTIQSYSNVTLWFDVMNSTKLHRHTVMTFYEIPIYKLKSHYDCIGMVIPRSYQGHIEYTHSRSHWDPIFETHSSKHNYKNFHTHSIFA